MNDRTTIHFGQVRMEELEDLARRMDISKSDLVRRAWDHFKAGDRNPFPEIVRVKREKE